jgi:HK97 family phage major capsid protein
MSQILELREKRAKAWDQAKSFLDASRDENGLVSAENAARYERMEADILALGKEVERLERQTAIDNELNAPLSTPITNAPQRTAEVKFGRASDEYHRDFFAAMRGKLVTNLLQESVDADGGYLCPTEFERQIVQGLDEANVIRSIAKTITTGAERKIPLAATPSTASWVAENGTIPESTITFAQKTLDAFKCTDLIKVSVELLQDSMFNLEAYIAREFARALGVAEEQAFCVGTGTGQPTGIFNATAGGHIGVTTASQTAIALDDIISLIYALKSPYRRNAVFLTNDTNIAALRKLKDNNGLYIWQPSIQQGVPDRLFGYPIHTSPYVPTVAAGTIPIAFGDFSSYWIADRAGRTLQRLNELYAGAGLVGFLMTERVDAKVVLTEGIQLLQMAAGGGGGGTT